MGRRVEYSEITSEDNFFERMRKDNKGKDWFRPAVERIRVDGIDYYYYLLRKEALRELQIPNTLVFKMVSRDPQTGKRVMLLGLRDNLGFILSRKIASEEIRAFKIGK